jgi:hypothetical protein
MQLPLGDNDTNYREFFTLPMYYGEAARSIMRNDLMIAVFSNISFLSQLDGHAFDDSEIPALYAMYDNAMAQLQCLTFEEFATMLTKADKPSGDHCDNNGNQRIREDIERLARQRFLTHGNTPLNKSALLVIASCRTSEILSGFFFQIMACSTRMARITGESNEYNDYRVKNDLHAMFFGWEIDPKKYDCFIYVYATGKVLNMERQLAEYKAEFAKEDFSSIGITNETPGHLWNKEHLQHLSK